MIKVYLTPFDGTGGFADELDVTPDVDLSSIGKIRLRLDSTEYDVGILRFSNLKLKMRNTRGKYSVPDGLISIFNERRSGSKVRVTWNIDEENPQCGNAICGSIRLGEEVDLFNGVLDDSNSKMNAGDQIVNFDVLSLDSLITKVTTPTILVSEYFTDAIYNILNQSEITKYLTVDASNISVSIDRQFDSVTWFSERSGKESLQKLLLASNSVLYVQGTTVYVSPRTHGASVVKTFYGQASEEGNEDILNLMKIRNGQNRIFNFVRFKDTTDVAKDTPSIEEWGIKPDPPKNLEIDFITNSTKREEICQNIVDEFKDPKQELDIEVELNYENYNLNLLDQIAIDYPLAFYSQGDALPIVEVAKTEDVTTPLPYEVWQFELDPDEITFKIMGFEIDAKRETISMNLRGI